MTDAFDDDDIAFVVLDSAAQAADPRRFDRLLEAFMRGYAKHFSGDEAESPASWRRRIAGEAPPQPIMRVVVAVAAKNGPERVVGGIASEYYRAARCMLATYLYVDDDPSVRHHGHARRLLDEARAACGKLGPVGAVFAEAEWPDALDAGGAAASAVSAARRRLQFFARLGARLIDIDYIQPALGPGKEPVSFLRLFVLPTAARSGRVTDDELSAITASFLTEFYAALAEDRGGHPDEAALDTLRAQLAGHRPLTSPLPHLRLADATLAFHFVEPLDDLVGADSLLDDVRKETCPVLHSMETDLLSRAYRKNRLFRTVCLTKPLPPASSGDDVGIPVEITFPRGIVFRSENREEARHWPLRRRVARAYLTPSFFLDARLIVWHLALKPGLGKGDAADAWFDELDLITLVKLTTDESAQELLRPLREGQSDRIGFRILDRPGGPHAVNEIVCALASVAWERLGLAVALPQQPLPPRAATIEILGWSVRGDQPFAGIDDDLARRAMCGIISGILDFDQLDDAEAKDTLTPSVAIDDALLCVHREALVYAREDDRAARTVAGAVGISPYLIIPFATILCNEALLQRAAALIPRGGRARSVTALSRALGRFEDTLHTRWVPNPFFYPTERKLYQCALVDGGLEARRATAEDLLVELKTRLELARAAQRERFEAVVTALVGAIAVASFDPMIIDVIAWLGAIHGRDPKLLGHGLTMLFAAVVGLVFLWLKWPTNERKRRLLRWRP